MFYAIEGTITLIGDMEDRNNSNTRYSQILIRNDLGQEKRVETVFAFNRLSEFISPRNTGKFYFRKIGKLTVLVAIEMAGHACYALDSTNEYMKHMKKKRLKFLYFAAPVFALGFYLQSLPMLAGISLATVFGIIFNALEIRIFKPLVAKQSIDELQEIGFAKDYKTV
jgi:hypothetical protein